MDWMCIWLEVDVDDSIVCGWGLMTSSVTRCTEHQLLSFWLTFPTYSTRNRFGISERISLPQCRTPKKAMLQSIQPACLLDSVVLWRRKERRRVSHMHATLRGREMSSLPLAAYGQWWTVWFCLDVECRRRSGGLRSWLGSGAEPCWKGLWLGCSGNWMDAAAARIEATFLAVDGVSRQWQSSSSSFYSSYLRRALGSMRIAPPLQNWMDHTQMSVLAML